MQDRTINNALIALRKQGGPQGKIAEALLDMRGVPLPTHRQSEPFKRGQAQRLALDALRNGAETTAHIAVDVLRLKSDITRRQAAHCAYLALLRLEGKGLVCRDGRAWRLVSA